MSFLRSPHYVRIDRSSAQNPQRELPRIPELPAFSDIRQYTYPSTQL